MFYRQSCFPLVLLALTTLALFVHPAQAQGYASRPNQTLLNTIVSGTITVYVNNRHVGTFTEAVTKRDISRFVRRGQNTLRVVLKPKTNKDHFNIDGVPNGFVKIAYAHRKNEFKDLAKVSFGGGMPGKTHKYDYRATFTIDSLTTGATGARTQSNRTRPTWGGRGYLSRPNQTLLSVNTSGDVSIFINGKLVETFSDAVIQRDITRFVRRGSNTLTVKLRPGTNQGVTARDGVPNGFAQVSYARRQDQFVALNKISFGPALPGRTHKLEYSATFRIGN